jgi:S-adenosyl-L-methionine hydrolase (adenosine-forming)
MAGRAFFGPDNGIFHSVLKKDGIKVFRIKPDYFQGHSSTFHGRDIFTPAAVAYWQGDRAFSEPVAVESLIMLPELDSAKLITYIDSFGNIKTNIAIMSQKTPEYTSLVINNKEYPITTAQVFADVLPGTLICYKGSNNTLEIAISGGSAEHYLNAHVGSEIDVY